MAAVSAASELNRVSQRRPTTVISATNARGVGILPMSPKIIGWKPMPHYLSSEDFRPNHFRFFGFAGSSVVAGAGADSGFALGADFSSFSAAGVAVSSLGAGSALSG